MIGNVHMFFFRLFLKNKMYSSLSNIGQSLLLADWLVARWTVLNSLCLPSICSDANNKNMKNGITIRLFFSSDFSGNKSSAKRDDGGDANASKGNTTFNMQKSKSSTNVGQVFSKKIWKSRSKSQTRPDSPAQQAHWMPQVSIITKF